MRKTIWVFVSVCVSLLAISWANASTATTDPNIEWAAPKATAIKRVSSTETAQHESNFLNNLDCQLMTYRMVNQPTMRTGCFTQTAFGLFDGDTETVIYNGTDEGLPLLPFSAHQAITPWPNALNVVALDAVNTGGSQIALYKNPLASLRDERDAFGKLAAKQLTAAPELPLRDISGQRLVINAQSLAFSDGGSWLVAESMNGMFVRVNLATLDTVAFAPAYGSQGSPALLNSRVAVSENGRFVAIQNDVAGEFKIYDLLGCTSSTVCPSYDYQAFVNANIPSLQSVRHLRFINDGLLGFETIAANSSQSGTFELAPQQTITSLTDYIAAGDSYTAGEGAFDYVSGTDTTSGKCHQSVHSYPFLLTKDLFSSSGGHSVACSGAITRDVAATSADYRGQNIGSLSLRQLQEQQPQLLESVESNYLPGYIAQQRFIKRWQPRVATVSIGGNDVGFGSLLEQCVMPHVSVHVSDSTCFNTYEDRLEVLNLINSTVPKWTSLYKQLRAESPESRIYAIGYPDIIDDTGKCALNVHLGKSELEFAAELLVYINKGVQQAAAGADVPYVDISHALDGHRLCEAASSNVAVNGLTAGRDSFVFGRESYHPNALGQQLIEQSILRQTNNLSSYPTTPPIIAGTKILDTPKSGRQIVTRNPATIAPSIIKRGASIAITVGGSNLRQNSSYQVRLGGTSGQLIGIVASDSSGNISTSVSAPGNLSPGGTTIDMVGPSQTDETVDITQPVYIPLSETDSDGDSVSDSSDSCSYSFNSNQDVDQDGIDDSCDVLISQPPADTPSSPNSTAAATSSPSSAASGGAALTQTRLIAATLASGKNDAQTDRRILTNSAVLGAHTVNPDTLPRGNFLPPKLSGASAGKSPWHNPMVLWWCWLLLLPLAVWLALVIIEKVYVRFVCAHACAPSKEFI